MVFFLPLQSSAYLPRTPYNQEVPQPIKTLHSFPCTHSCLSSPKHLQCWKVRCQSFSQLSFANTTTNRKLAIGLTRLEKPALEWWIALAIDLITGSWPTTCLWSSSSTRWRRFSLSDCWSFRDMDSCPLDHKLCNVTSNNFLMRHKNICKSYHLPYVVSLTSTLNLFQNRRPIHGDICYLIYGMSMLGIHKPSLRRVASQHMQVKP